MELAEKDIAVVDLAELLDQDRLGSLRIQMFFLCGLVAMLDGFDVQIMGIVGLFMAAAIHIPIKTLGVVFSATLLGLAFGALLLGALADRIGRRPVLVVATAAFGLFSFATAFVSSLDQLLLVRFLAGLGLGGAMPNFIGLVSDYAPRHRRGVLVAMLWTGFPVGGVLAGVIAPHAIGAFGWRSMFYIGGVLPIVLAVAIAWTIPESLSILLRLGTRSEEVRRTVGRLWPALRPGCPAKFVLGDEEPNCGSVWLLFSGGRARFTILLCLGFFTTFLLLITTVVWTPTLLQTGGMNVSAAATALIALNLGSVVGTPLAGLLIGPQRPKRVLVTAFVFCAVALALLGRAASTLTLIAALMSMIGFLLGAGSSALIALVAQFYPDSVRSTALGAAMAAGRLGSFAGPLAVGILVGWHWSTSAIFTAIATPALVSALCAALLCSARAR